MSKEKKDFELDFDRTDSYEQFHVPEKETIKPLGLNIAIKKGNQYLLKDLAFLTNEEMIEWLKQVYPIGEFDRLDSKILGSRVTKAQIFDQVSKFHTTILFPIPLELVKTSENKKVKKKK